MKYLLGIDLGTSGTKTVLFNENGDVIASKTVEYPLSQPRNGWAEQNPLDWWNAVCAGMRHCVSHVTDIAGIGISGQMHGLVMLDEDGEVLRPSIIWCDQRTQAECDEMTEKIGHRRLMEITANPAMTGFTASKILWVKNNEPEIYQKCAHILLPKDYIRYMLTGDFATEVSDAGGMQLLDVPGRCWSEEVLTKLGIDGQLLGRLYESCEITGVVQSSASRMTGVPAGTPVVGGAGDNFAAAVGTGVVRKGRAFTTLGTSGVVFAHADNVKIDPAGRIHTFCSAVPGKWCVMSCTQAAGLSLRWTRDTLCTEEVAAANSSGKDPYEVMSQEAARIPIGSDRLFYLPYLMGERSPILDPFARGVFFGLSAMHTRAHMIRAVMEGVAFSQLDCVNVFREMGIPIDDMTACGGGARSPLWRQMLADMYGCGVATLAADEGPALGVAILAGVGTGIYESVESACDRMVKKKPAQPPQKENSAVYARYYDVFRSLYPAMKDSFRSLSQL